MMCKNSGRYDESDFLTIDQARCWDHRQEIHGKHAYLLNSMYRVHRPEYGDPGVYRTKTGYYGPRKSA